MNASTFATFTSRFSNMFATILNVSTDALEVQYNESSGEFLINARSLSSSEEKTISDKIKNQSNFINLIKEAISNDDELKDKEVEVEKAPLPPSIEPVLSKLNYST